jgi:hypothetical protein
MISFTFRHGPWTFAAALLIVVLCVVDAYLTIDLVGRGAEEFNPIMAYYLKQSPLLFFAVKYSMTCTGIMMIISMKNDYVFGKKIRVRFLLVFFLFALAIVTQWQLFLLCQMAN